MLIDDFKKYFNLDNMDLSYGNKPTIELSNYDYWNKTRVAYLNGFDASGKTMTLHFIENCKLSDIFRFDNLSDFDNVDEVLFKLNGVIVKDVEFDDMSVSDRCYCFSTNFDDIPEID